MKNIKLEDGSRLNRPLTKEWLEPLADINCQKQLSLYRTPMQYVAEYAKDSQDFLNNLSAQREPYYRKFLKKLDENAAIGERLIAVDQPLTWEERGNGFAGGFFSNHDYVSILSSKAVRNKFYAASDEDRMFIIAFFAKRIIEKNPGVDYSGFCFSKLKDVMTHEINLLNGISTLDWYSPELLSSPQEIIFIVYLDTLKSTLQEKLPHLEVSLKNNLAKDVDMDMGFFQSTIVWKVQTQISIFNRDLFGQVMDQILGEIPNPQHFLQNPNQRSKKEAFAYSEFIRLTPLRRAAFYNNDLDLRCYEAVRADAQTKFLLGIQDHPDSRTLAQRDIDMRASFRSSTGNIMFIAMMSNLGMFLMPFIVLSILSKSLGRLFKPATALASPQNLLLQDKTALLKKFQTFQDNVLYQKLSDKSLILEAKYTEAHEIKETLLQQEKWTPDQEKTFQCKIDFIQKNKAIIAAIQAMALEVKTVCDALKPLETDHDIGPILTRGQEIQDRIDHLEPFEWNKVFNRIKKLRLNSPVMYPKNGNAITDTALASKQEIPAKEINYEDRRAHLLTQLHEEMRLIVHKHQHIQTEYRENQNKILEKATPFPTLYADVFDSLSNYKLIREQDPVQASFTDHFSKLAKHQIDLMQASSNTLSHIVRSLQQEKSQWESERKNVLNKLKAFSLWEKAELKKIETALDRDIRSSRKMIPRSVPETPVESSEIPQAQNAQAAISRQGTERRQKLEATFRVLIECREKAEEVLTQESAIHAAVLKAQKALIDYLNIMMTIPVDKLGAEQHKKITDWRNFLVHDFYIDPSLSTNNVQTSIRKKLSFLRNFMCQFQEVVWPTMQATGLPSLADALQTLNHDNPDPVVKYIHGIRDVLYILANLQESYSHTKNEETIALFSMALPNAYEVGRVWKDSDSKAMDVMGLYTEYNAFIDTMTSSHLRIGIRNPMMHNGTPNSVVVEDFLTEGRFNFRLFFEQSTIQAEALGPRFELDPPLPHAPKKQPTMTAFGVPIRLKEGA